MNEEDIPDIVEMNDISLKAYVVGMLGTPEHKQVNMEAAEGVASKDFEDYVNHAMHRE